MWETRTSTLTVSLGEIGGTEAQGEVARAPDTGAAFIGHS
jgi:hypothetical protein